MNRRELLRLIGMATGMVMIGASDPFYVYSQPLRSEVYNDFSKDEVALMDEIAETIIPRTDTLGAKDASCGLLMAQFVTDCYSPDEQELFRKGLADFKARTENRFMIMTPTERADLFRTLHTELRVPDTEDGPPKPYYFTMFKQLTLFAFFTSEGGATQVLRYIAVPGRFEEIPYEVGMRAWATT